jgi:inorganic pyrophosphatase
MSDLKPLTAGNNTPDEINVIIEIQKGNHNKYEIDKETGYLFLERVNATALGYATDYGYVPMTLCEDGDPLDAMVVIDEPIPHGVAVSVRPVGVLYMVDNGENDEKLICVVVNDVTKSHIKKVEDLGPNFKPMVEHFYSNYKAWKNDWKGSPVSFNGWGDADAAKKVITESIERYTSKH